MVRTKKCKDCGTFNEHDSKFCEKCGNSLNSKKQNNSNNNNSLDFIEEKKINNINRDDFMDRKILEKINTGLATVFSAIFIGLGQLYNGQITKGICLFIIGIILGGIELFFNLLANNAPAYIDPTIFVILMLPALIIYICLWIYSVNDAHKNSKEI